MQDERQVLVIDDSDISLELMASVLEDAGISVVKLSGPIGATQAVAKSNVQVLVTDVNMPALRGNNLIGLIRGNRRTRHVKVVLVSSLPEQQLLTLAAEADADGVVQKDRIETDLVLAVRRLFREYRDDKRQAQEEDNASDEPESSGSPLSSVRARLARLTSGSSDVVNDSSKPSPEKASNSD